MLRLFLLLIVTTLFCSTVSANSLELDDFAYGLELNLDGDAAIYRLTMTKDVYQGVVRQDLGDIRVFNGAGQLVPHAIRTPDNREQVTSRINLPFFPLTAEADAVEGDKLDVELAQDGAIVSIRTEGNSLVIEDAQIDSYLIDASGIKQRIDAMEFELSGYENSFIKSLRLEHSDDLNSWRPLVPEATVTHLQYGAYDLAKNRITIPTQHQRYIRFTWQGGGGDRQLRSVYAILSSERAWDARIWSTVEGKLIDKKRQIYEYDTGGLYAIDRINIMLPERNSLVEVTLKSSANNGKAWRSRYSGLFYNLEVEGTNLQNNPVNIYRNRDRYWRIHVMTEDGLGDSPPRLRIAWLANELLFLARGDGPFTLAYGSGKAGPPDRPVNTLLNVLNDNQENSIIGTATINRRMELSGKAALRPSVDLDWRTLSLWGVLILGVLVLAFMAYRLFRQLNSR